MQSFVQYAPTEIIFGPGSEDKTAELVKKYGGTKVILVYGKGSVEKSGLLEKISTALEAQGIKYLGFGGAMPNPHLSFAREGVKAAIEFGADFVLAVGGGSAIDAAKAIAHGAKNPDIDIWRFWTRELTVEASIPVGVVLTISAAGSETSSSSVITNTETGEKRGINTDFNRPRFAIMNPELTYTLPRYQLSCGIADIYMHTLDRYFTPEANEGKINEMTDEIAEALMRVVIKNGQIILDDPTNYQAQSEIMWAGSLSHNGITGLGRTMDFSVHQLGHELGGRFDVAHGASLTTMWSNWARHALPVNPPRFAQYARKVLGVTETHDELAAQEGILLTEEFFTKIEMPISFSELGIGVQTKDVVEQLALSCVHHGKRLVGSFKPLDFHSCLQIYWAANR